MSVKTGKGRRWVEMEIDLAGTPDQVWRAVATGHGTTAWFVPCEIEERVGGAVAFHFGDGIESKGEVTVWEPSHRFAYDEKGWSGDAPPLATEILIEANAGGACRMRMTHSLFTEKGDWDKEIEGMENGWPPFFDVLRIYLSHFPDRRAASVRPTTPHAGTMLKAWSALTDVLELKDAKLGDRREVRPRGPAALSGIVERIGENETHHEIALRLSEPAAGVALIGAYFWGGDTRIAVSLYFYGDDSTALAKREGERWQSWMKETFFEAKKAR